LIGALYQYAYETSGLFISIYTDVNYGDRSPVVSVATSLLLILYYTNYEKTISPVNIQLNAYNISKSKNFSLIQIRNFSMSHSTPS